jgi:hypothetical protein
MNEIMRVTVLTMFFYTFHTMADNLYRAHCRRNIFHVAFFGNSRMCVALEGSLRMVEHVVTNMFFVHEKK